eukprot:TRINITY_DN21215_c0_g1_i1.p1 TRINITY_DN21215_c0_g1~~TRINITY_DN21215_c0_g1_i1.p1  ORF type:complete len:368 (+),score=-66.51 TRINITY_DN21215_c0_g1_i1:984-2087(+)
MQFIDLVQQYEGYKAKIDAAVLGVLQHGQYINGPEVHCLETALAHYVGVSDCIGVSSGTTALQVALMALDLQPGDEVITTPFSFFATTGVLLLLGIRPVYVDIEPETYNIDVQKIEQAITSKTRAILPVNLYGHPADFSAISAIATKYDLPVIEDAAQSFGAEYHGKKSCALTTIGCASFFPSKPLGAYGDAGACFTNDPEIARKIRSLINHGQVARYSHEYVGINGRIDTLQSAILLEKFAFFPEEIQLRRDLFNRYTQYLPETVRKPCVKPGVLSAHAQYTIEVEARDQVVEFLAQKGIPTAIHYPKGLHQQAAMQNLFGEASSYPVTERAAARVLSLPFYPGLPEAALNQVVEAIRAIPKTFLE